jgi:hypothetical protein
MALLAAAAAASLENLPPPAPPHRVRIGGQAATNLEVLPPRPMGLEAEPFFDQTTQQQKSIAGAIDPSLLATGANP